MKLISILVSIAAATLASAQSLDTTCHSSSSNLPPMTLAACLSALDLLPTIKPPAGGCAGVITMTQVYAKHGSCSITVNDKNGGAHCHDKSEIRKLAALVIEQCGGDSGKEEEWRGGVVDVPAGTVGRLVGTVSVEGTWY